MNGFLLHGFDLERLELLVENLTLKVTQLINSLLDGQDCYSLDP